MRLISRIHDLFLANANHTIDRAEDPEKMIKQAIRELDEDIRQARAAVVNALASEKQLALQLERHRKRSEELAKKAESAVAAGEEELARKVLAQKVGDDRIADELEPSWRSAKKTGESLKSQLDVLVHKRAEISRKRESLFARQRAAEARTQLSRSMAAVNVPEATGEKFARMQERVTEMEAESLAVAEVMCEEVSPEREVADLERSTQVDAELRALKERVRPSSPDDESQTKS